MGNSIDDRNVPYRYKALAADLKHSVGLSEIWLVLGWHDIKQRYRRSVIGPFWITIATLIFLSIVTFIYSTLLRQSVTVFLPFAAIGLVTWGLISNCLTEGAKIFIDQSAAIKQLPLPLPVHVLRMMWQQLVIMLHNTVVIALIMIAVRRPVHLDMLMVVPAMLLVLINLCWMSILFGIVGVRFRDVPIIINAIVPILFLVTPVLWSRAMLPASRTWAVNLNPIASLLDIVRQPILGGAPDAWNWVMCVLTAAFGWAITSFVYTRCRHRVALWV